jgi:CRISPR/Cas system CSM-associated protein Csm3 (group 7 of RAMP superfamily)
MTEPTRTQVGDKKPSSPFWSADRSRKICARWVIEGDLVLQTPAHFGNGDSADLTDMPLLKAADDDKTPLLTGASIAGALRAYLRSCQQGLRAPKQTKAELSVKFERESAAVCLFGGSKCDDEGQQSPLIVEDAYGAMSTVIGTEIRNGVRLNGHSRTAENDALFNLEAWLSGTKFPLRFELLVCDGDDETQMLSALATALQGFSDGGITLGARKARGFGRVHVPAWRAQKFDLKSVDGLVNWLSQGKKQLAVTEISDIGTALNGAKVLPNDQRDLFELSATFALDGSLLVRSGGGQDTVEPDMVHITSAGRPILPGTSLAGALRARANKIANTLASDRDRARDFVECLFGRDMNQKKARNQQPTASRILVEEHEVTLKPNVAGGGRFDLVQSRVAIDRFTGGALDTALFTEQPVFGGEQTEVQVRLKLINPTKAEVGLVLLLLKDLWTGDLPLGGEISVGRGRLKGKQATLTWKRQDVNCTIKANGDALQPLDAYTTQKLNGYVDELKSCLTATQQKIAKEVV